jgi:phosphoribosylglycinamide formyltransferase-1
VTAHLVVLASGNGSNLQAILDACSSGVLPARVAAVISDKPQAYALERARQAGVPALARPKYKDDDRADYDAALADTVADQQPDWIVLAGWMRLLSMAFLARFPGQVINLHPALPGTFPGAHAIEDALAAYQRGEIKETGVMVHRVPDEGVDNGPVLAQQVVEILPGDTVDSLAARMHAVEHELLVGVLKELCMGQGEI